MPTTVLSARSACSFVTLRYFLRISRIFGRAEAGHSSLGASRARRWRRHGGAIGGCWPVDALRLGASRGWRTRGWHGGWGGRWPGWLPSPRWQVADEVAHPCAGARRATNGRSRCIAHCHTDPCGDLGAHRSTAAAAHGAGVSGRHHRQSLFLAGSVARAGQQRHRLAPRATRLAQNAASHREVVGTLRHAKTAVNPSCAITGPPAAHSTTSPHRCPPSRLRRHGAARRGRVPTARAGSLQTQHEWRLRAGRHLCRPARAHGLPNGSRTEARRCPIRL